MFITFEGGEGTGKSTQAALLAEYVRQLTGRKVVLTREPGGTPEGEAVRKLFLNGEWSPTAQTLLMYAARDAHINKVIRPALAAGEIVICDRYIDSTRVYQYDVAEGGHINGILLDTLEMFVATLRPDLTIVLDVPVDLATERLTAREYVNKYDQRSAAFHQSVRGEFKRRTVAYPDRCKLVDASGDKHEVFQNVIEVFDNFYNSTNGGLLR